MDQRRPRSIRTQPKRLRPRPNAIQSRPNLYGLGQSGYGLGQRFKGTAQTPTGLANSVRARPTGPHAQYRAHERVSKPTGLTRTRAYSSKRALSTVNSTWV